MHSVVEKKAENNRVMRHTQNTDGYEISHLYKKVVILIQQNLY